VYLLVPRQVTVTAELFMTHSATVHRAQRLHRLVLSRSTLTRIFRIEKAGLVVVYGWLLAHVAMEVAGPGKTPLANGAFDGCVLLAETAMESKEMTVRELLATCRTLADLQTRRF